MLDFHKNHKHLVNTSFLVFVALSFFIAVIPAIKMQNVQPLPGMQELTLMEREGLELYVAENCVACHTQQVRNIEMDEVWGDRPAMPSDYYYSKQRQDFWRQSPSLLGSERTGPDLTNVGKRQPSQDWHLLHLYNPRIVVKASIMPGYSWLFEEKLAKDVSEEDVVVPVPANYLSNEKCKIVASQDALRLVAYLQSLQQAPVVAEKSIAFIPSTNNNVKGGSEEAKGLEGLNGEKLFMATCAACHQQNGEGITGAFPSLVNSGIVNDENPETLIRIILQGYDARTEYGVMPGFANQLTDEQLAAIATYERSHWGNEAPEVLPETVKQIREFASSLTP